MNIALANACKKELEEPVVRPFTKIYLWEARAASGLVVWSADLQAAAHP